MSAQNIAKNNTDKKAVIWFWIHLFFLFASWVAPFVFPWKFLIIAYSTVLLQFVFFGRCLMNSEHGLDDAANHTFYAELMEKMGMKPNRDKVKRFVRSWIYLVLFTIGFVWQEVLGKGYLLDAFF